MWLSLSLSHAGQWKFNMTSHGKELSEDLKKIIVALHKDGVGYKKIAKTLKLSCSMVAIQRFNRTCSSQNRPHHGPPKKLSARAQRHIQRLCLGNRCMSAASIAAEVEGVGGQPVSAQTICRTLNQIGLHGCRPRRKPLLKMMHKKARTGKLQFIEGTMNANMYCDILKQSMIPSIQRLGCRAAVFPHDNDHCLAKEAEGKGDDWPSMSPDLNPIEHVWGILKQKVAEGKVSNIHLLRDVVMEEWKRTPVATC